MVKIAIFLLFLSGILFSLLAFISFGDHCGGRRLWKLSLNMPWNRGCLLSACAFTMLATLISATSVLHLNSPALIATVVIISPFAMLVISRIIIDILVCFVVAIVNIFQFTKQWVTTGKLDWRLLIHVD